MPTPTDHYHLRRYDIQRDAYVCECGDTVHRYELYMTRRALVPDDPREQKESAQ